ncbi:MAG: HYR domain-containing protein, partial [Gammaproteobacteria bacterium]|nr:HYR domain-containing protein [Gammaproteobacteria bacterium]
TYGASTTAISTDPTGFLGDDASNSPRVNHSGNFIVYDTSATNIVATNGQQQVIRANQSTGQSILVSQSSSGIPGNQYSFESDISSDGDTIVFSSYAQNLTPDSVSTYSNVFLRLITENKNLLISNSRDGSNPNGYSDQPTVSGDGKWVAFVSTANNLTYDQTNGTSNIYLKNIVTGKTTLVTAGADGGSITPNISYDGNYITFASAATNLSADIDNNDAYDIYLYNRTTNSFSLISKNDLGQIGNKKSANPVISDDGRFIAYHSFSTSLDVDYTTSSFNVFLHDTQLGTTRLVSRNGSTLANSISLHAHISSNGRFISFITRASNLSTPDTNTGYDLVVYDRILDKFETLSRNNSGQQVDGSISFISDLSGDGQVGVFASGAPNLGANNSVNVFARVRDPIANLLPVANAGADQNILCTGINTTVFLDGSQSYDTDGSLVSYSWNDGFNSINGVQTSFLFSPGIHTVTLSVRDDQNDMGSDQTVINIIDNQPPQIPLSTIELEASSSLGSPYTFQLAASDNCSDAQLSITNALDYYPLGTSEVTLIATDGSQNTTTELQTITIVDTTPPVFDVVPDITSEAMGTLSEITLNTPSVIDHFLKDVTNDAPALFGLGTHNVTWTATDTSGNTTQANQKVSVVDTTPPVLDLGPMITLEATSKDGAAYTINPVEASDSCQCGQLTLDIQPKLAFYPLGETSLQATLTDQSGNSVTDTLVIKVVDTTAPVLSLPLNITAEATDIKSVVDLTPAIASDLFSVSISHNAPASFPVGTTEVTWTATDANNNSVSGIQKVTIIDTTLPQFTSITDMTVEANNVLSNVVLTKPVVSDIFLINLINNAPISFPLGKTTVTWTAIDANGNSNTAIQNVTVVDTTAPTLIAPPNLTIEATALLSEVQYGFATANDIFSTSISHNAPMLFPVGTSVIVWSAIDKNGNTSSQTQLITVVDTTAPTFTIDILKDELWPPRHRLMHAANVVNVKDLVDDAPIVDIVVITEDNHKRRHRHKMEHEDWKIEQADDQWEIWLRAEKLIRSKEDRIYKIEVSVSDKYGNQNMQTAEISVPHAKGKYAKKHIKHDKRDHKDGKNKEHKHTKNNKHDQEKNRKS